MLIYLFAVAILLVVTLLFLCIRKPEIRDFYIDFSIFPPRIRIRVKKDSCNGQSGKKHNKESSCVKNSFREAAGLEK